MKDDYLNFLKRENIRREKEHQEKIKSNENIYNQVKERNKKDQSIINEDTRSIGGRSHTPRVQSQNVSTTT